jgi:hypothetical protein
MDTKQYCMVLCWVAGSGAAGSGKEKVIKIRLFY